MKSNTTTAMKRWIYGRRTEKIVEGAGQRHLFDLESSSPSTLPLELAPEPPTPPAAPRRSRRELDLAKLPHYRHEHDLSEADKQCSGCGRTKDRIGQDESRVLEYVPANRGCLALTNHDQGRPPKASKSFV